MEDDDEDDVLEHDDAADAKGENVKPSNVLVDRKEEKKKKAPKPLHRLPEFYRLRKNLRKGLICLYDEEGISIPKDVYVSSNKRHITIIYVEGKKLVRHHKLRDFHEAQVVYGEGKMRYGILLDKLGESEKSPKALSFSVDDSDFQIALVALLVALRNVAPRPMTKKAKSVLKHALFNAPHIREYSMAEIAPKTDFVECSNMEGTFFTMIDMLMGVDDLDSEGLGDMLDNAYIRPSRGMKPELIVSSIHAAVLLEHLVGWDRKNLDAREDDPIWADDHMPFITFWNSCESLFLRRLKKIFEEQAEMEPGGGFNKNMPWSQFVSFLIRTQKESTDFVNNVKGQLKGSRALLASTQDDMEPSLPLIAFSLFLSSPSNPLFDVQKKERSISIPFNKCWISTAYIHYLDPKSFQASVPHCRCFSFNCSMKESKLTVQLVNTEISLAEALMYFKEEAFSLSKLPVLLIFFIDHPEKHYVEFLDVIDAYLGHPLWTGDLSNVEAASGHFIVGVFDNIYDPSLWRDGIDRRPACLNEAPILPPAVFWEPSETPKMIEQQQRQQADDDREFYSSPEESGKDDHRVDHHGKPTPNKKTFLNKFFHVGGGKKKEDEHTPSNHPNDSPSDAPQPKFKARRTIKFEADDESNSPVSGGGGGFSPASGRSEPSSPGSTANRTIFSSVTIKVHGADSLPKPSKTRDTFVYISLCTKESDGYRDIEKHGLKAKTKTVHKSQNPEWNFECHFEFPPEYHGDADGLYIKFLVVQENRFSANHNLGYAICAMPVAIDKSGTELDFSIFPLDAKHGDGGRITVSFKAHLKGSSAGAPKMEGSHKAPCPDEEEELAYWEGPSIERVCSRPFRIEGIHRASTVGHENVTLTDRNVKFHGIGCVSSNVATFATGNGELIFGFPVCMDAAPHDVGNPVAFWLKNMHMVAYSPGLSSNSTDLNTGWFENGGGLGYVEMPSPEDLSVVENTSVRLEILGGRLLGHGGRANVRADLYTDTTSSGQTEWSRAQFGCYEWTTPIHLTTNKPKVALLSISVWLSPNEVGGLKSKVLRRVSVPLSRCREGIRWIEFGKRETAGILVKLSFPKT